GVELRFRARPVELEFDLGVDNYDDDRARSDTRVAGTIYLPLVNARLAPYLLAGVGMNFSHFSTTGDELHQGFLAGGGGLALKLGSRFVISLDGRYMIRKFFDDETEVAIQLRGPAGAPAVVLCNGLGGTFEAFRYVYETLGEHYRIVCWDYRGL